MRVTAVATAVSLLLLGLSRAGDVHAAMSARAPIHIPPEALSSALQTLAKQRNLVLAYRSEVVGSTQTAGASGDLTRNEALTRLLRGTGLTYRYLDENTITILPLPAGSDGTGLTRPPSGLSPAPSAAASPGAAKEGKRSSSRGFRLAAVAQGSVAPHSAVIQRDSGGAYPQLKEVIVTAEKRAERIQDVPIPMTAINADTLVESNQLSLQDYYSSIPGLNVSPQSVHSVLTLSLRGITTGSFGNSPVVGVTLDDMPLGSSTSVGGGVIAPDIDPSDLAGIEVLRGPQGTLYGASSLGGLLKYATVDPSTKSLYGSLSVGTEAIRNGGGAGYSFHGSINVPVGDTLALRVSGFSREDPGYIDNPIYRLRDVNETHVRGGMVSTLWQPADVFSLKLLAFYQDRKAGGSTDVNLAINGYTGPPPGDLQQTYFPGMGKNEGKIEAYSATGSLNLGAVHLTSVTGYNETSYSDTFDFTYALGAFANSLFPPADGGPIYEHGITNKFTQELRLTTPLGSRVDWLLGGYYTHESSRYLETIYATEIATGENLGVLYLNPALPTGAGTVSEFAAFTDLTFHITDRLDVQVGGREGHITQGGPASEATGPLAGGVAITGASSTSSNPFTYLLTPRFKFSDNLMLYARLASGYRAGGGGAQGPAALCVIKNFPCGFGPDKTYDYEVGVKGSTEDHLLTFDSSVFYIDWKDIQVAAVSQGLYGYTSNGGRARSRGAELSLEVRPVDELTLSARFAYTDAELTQNFPGFPNGPLYGKSGDRLPDSSRFMGYFAAERRFVLSNSLAALVGADVRYVGDHIGQFNSTSQRQYYPPYAQTDIHAGLIYGAWSGALFVNNVADRRGVLSGGLGTYPPFAFTYIQPRTLGLSITKSL